MSKLGFEHIDDVLAATAHDIVVDARRAAIDANELQKAAPEIETITGLVDPPAVIIERAAFAALGSLAKAANDTSSAASAKGVNVPLDQETINDYKQLYQMLAAELKAQGQTVPTAASSQKAATSQRA